jgi:hypothetical protein
MPNEMDLPMLRTKIMLKTMSVLILTIALGACVSVERDDDAENGGDRPVPTPEPTATEPADTTPEADPTPTTEPVEPDEWYELLTSEKSYPEEAVGDQILELAENQEEFEELWARFQIEASGDVSDVDWDSSVVLFAGTGESGGCPLVLEDVSFDKDERIIRLAAEMDVPEDTMCTMDWTPRVFVIAMDSAYLGEGELRAGFNDDSGGTVIREE